MTISDICIVGILYLSSLLGLWFHFKKNHVDHKQCLVPIVAMSTCALLSIVSFVALKPVLTATAIPLEQNDVIYVKLQTLQSKASDHIAHKEYAEALSVYRMARFYFPEHANLANNMGVVYALMGNKRKEKLFYKQALAIDPNFQEAKDNLKQAKKEAVTRL